MEKASPDDIKINFKGVCSIGDVFLLMDKRELTDLIKVKNLDESVSSIDIDTRASASKILTSKMNKSKSREVSNDIQMKKNISIPQMMQKKMNNIELKPEEMEFFSQAYKNKVMVKVTEEQSETQQKKSLFIFKPNNPLRCWINQLKNSRLWRYIIRVILLLELFSLSMVDYSYRAQPNEEANNNSSIWQSIQMTCNTLFALEVAFLIIGEGFILEKGTHFRKKWNILNLVVVIFSFFTESSDPIFAKICSLVKITRIIRLLTSFESLNIYVYAYSHAFYSVGGYFFNFFFFMFFYAVVGTHLFKGLVENRCRESEFPPSDPKQIWAVSLEHPLLCDKSTNSCPQGTFCKTLYEYGLDSYPHEAEIPSLNFGRANFDNIFMAFVTNLNFVSFTGWSSINDIFWKATNPTIFVIYGITLMIILGVVLKNMLIAGVYQALVSNASGINKKIFAQEKMRLNQEKKYNVACSMMNLDLNFKANDLQENYKSRSKFEKLRQAMKAKTILLQNLMKKPSVQKYIPLGFSLLCILNICIFIALDYYPKSSIKNVLLIFDQMITCIYMTDSFMRFFAILITNSKIDVVIVTDVLITSLSFLEVILEFNSINFTAGSLKYLKVLRFFKLFQYLKRLRALTLLYKETMLTLYSLGYFLLTIFVMILIISLIGREFFAHRVKFDSKEHFNLTEGTSPRLNYDNILNSITTTIIIFYNEEWHAIMYEYMRGYSNYSAIYFSIVLIIGDFFSMKIFMALFINNLLKSEGVKKFFGLNTLWTRALAKIKKHLKRSDKQFKVLIIEVKKNRYKTLSLRPEDSLKACIQLKESEPTLETTKRQDKSPTNFAPNEGVNLQAQSLQIQPKKVKSHSTHSLKLINFTTNMLIRTKSKVLAALRNFFNQKTTKKYSRLGKKSLGLWALESPFRRKVFKLITHKYYDRLILVLIFISCFLLIIRNPLEDPDSIFNNFLFVTDVVLLWLYFLEIFFSSVAYGFLFNGKQSFLRNKINMFDFIIFLVTILGTIDAKYVLVRGVYIKICRAFRIFKLVKFHDGLRQLFTTLLNSLNQLFYLFLFYLIPLIIFAFIASNIFRGGFSYCVGLEESLLEEVKTRSDCFDWGGNWLLKDFNYENVFQAMGTLFQIATTENWISIMFNSWDFVGHGHQPEKNKQPLWIIFFITYFFICNIVMANILLGVFVEKFLMERNKKSPYKEYSEEQKEWAMIKSAIIRMKPKKIEIPKSELRKRLGLIIYSEIFHWVDFLSSVANLIVISSCWYRQDLLLKKVLESLNLAFVCIFFFQIHLKIAFHGPISFSRKKLRNSLEYLAIMYSFIINILKSSSAITENAYIDGIASGLQLLKVLPIVRKIPMMRRLLSTIYSIVPQTITITMLLLIFLIIYSLIGVEFFPFLKVYNVVGNEDVHFRTFQNAMHTLLRGATGEGWPVFLSDTIRKTQPNYPCTEIIDYEGYNRFGLEGCGKSVGYFFWYSFTILITWLILNLFFALILCTIDEHKTEEEITISRSMLKSIAQMWSKYDPKGEGFISYKDFLTFSNEVFPILSLEEEEFKEINSKQDFLKALQLPVYINKDKHIYGYKFHDSLINLSKLIIIMKYGVLDLEPTKLLKKDIRRHFKSKKQNDSFIETNYTSSDLACFVVLQKFIYLWKKKLSKKQVDFKSNDPVFIKRKSKRKNSLFYQKNFK